MGSDNISINYYTQIIYIKNDRFSIFGNGVLKNNQLGPIVFIRDGRGPTILVPGLITSYRAFYRQAPG